MDGRATRGGVFISRDAYYSDYSELFESDDSLLF